MLCRCARRQRIAAAAAVVEHNWSSALGLASNQGGGYSRTVLHPSGSFFETHCQFTTAISNLRLLPELMLDPSQNIQTMYFIVHMHYGPLLLDR